jgi:hypothetical protein
MAGSITVTAGLLALVYAIVHTDQVSWTSESTLAVLGIAVVLLASFVLIEAKLASHPLVPLRLFRSRAVTGANLVMFCFGVAMFAMWFFLSLATALAEASAGAQTPAAPVTPAVEL